MPTLSNGAAWAEHQTSWKCMHLSLTLGYLQDVCLFSGIYFGTEKNKIKISICREMGCQNDIISFMAVSSEHMSLHYMAPKGGACTAMPQCYFYLMKVMDFYGQGRTGQDWMGQNRAIMVSSETNFMRKAYQFRISKVVMNLH